MRHSSQVPQAWKDGNLFVLSRHMPEAPDRCILTNEPVFGPSKITRQLSWGDNGPASWVPVKLQLLFALANMQHTLVTFGLSGRFRLIRWIAMGLALTAIVLGAYLFFKGLGKGIPPPMSYVGTGAALCIVAITILVNTYSVIDIVRMNEDFVWLRGAKKPFLDSLPLFQKANEHSRNTK